nr:hypothetical protein [Candidatus Aenigmarchaeota archaeon]
ELLKGKKKIALMGCGGCATFYNTGGIKQVKEMAKNLGKKGKEVTAQIKLPLGIEDCEIEFSHAFLDANRKKIEDSDAMLILCCGNGVQVVADYLDEKLGIAKPVFPSVDVIGVVGGGPNKYKENCLSCGQCELGKVASICPLTNCTKGLMNGPCGGIYPDGKCEADPEKDCAWIRIYQRLDGLGDLEKLTEIREPHDWSKAQRPRLLDIEPISITKTVIASIPSYASFVLKKLRYSKPRESMEK